MIVVKSSVFPAQKERVFSLLTGIDTLKYVAAPMMTFEETGEGTAAWAPGSVSSFELRLFGVIPFGIHTIRIVSFSPDGISSREGNSHVPVWNHDITLEDVSGGGTLYTDRVQIRAGMKTPFIWLWAEMFYAHRQRRWIRLLETERP